MISRGLGDEANLQSYSAIRLFAQHAQRVHASFTLSTANQLHVLRLCQLVNGMPLGLELAAAWLPLLSCAEIVAEIERDLDFLTDSARHVADRHRSMRVIFESSWHLLSAPEQDVLKKLSVFKGKFQREAARQVTGASLQLLLALLSKSLLQRDAGGRYSMHELLRQYVAEKLAAGSGATALENGSDPVGEAQASHSHYYLRFLQEREAHLLGGGRQQETLTEIGDALENIEAAWYWTATHGGSRPSSRLPKLYFSFATPAAAFRKARPCFSMPLIGWKHLWLMI